MAFSMGNGNKRNILIIALVLVLGFFGFEYGKKAEVRNVPKETEPLNSKAESLHQEMAKDACPALFSKSADDYLANAASGKNDEQKCFVSGCGGSL